MFPATALSHRGDWKTGGIKSSFYSVEKMKYFFLHVVIEMHRNIGVMFRKTYENIDCDDSTYDWDVDEGEQGLNLALPVSPTMYSSQTYPSPFDISSLLSPPSELITPNDDGMQPKKQLQHPGMGFLKEQCNEVVKQPRQTGGGSGGCCNPPPHPHPRGSRGTAPGKLCNFVPSKLMEMAFPGLL